MSDKVPRKQERNLPAKPGIFLQQTTPEKLLLTITKRGINSETKALQTKSASLGDIKNSYGDRTAITFITLQIDDLAKFMNNDSKQMNQMQQHQTAMLIIGEFFYLNVAEIALVFSRIKLGHFDKSYGPINGQYILKCFREYCEKRNRKLLELRRKNQQEKVAREMEGREPNPERARELLNKVANKFKSE